MLADVGLRAASADAPFRTCRVAMIGAGYVGLVSGACLAHLGHRVTLIEIDPQRLAALRAGAVPIREAGLDPIVEEGVHQGLLDVTDEYSVVGDVDLVMVAVGTPSRPDGHVDLAAVEQTVVRLALVAPRALVVIKSTVPPGTCARLEALAHGLGADGVRVVSNPEFLREGRAVADFMAPDRVVIGARREADADLVAALYAPLEADVIRCRPEEAELAKYASNALLAARISFMNEISAIADRVGADVTRVSAIVGSDRRIGPAFLTAGLGWGGSCFPKDVHGLASVAEDLGLPAPMLRASLEANTRQRERALRLALEMLRDEPRPRVGLLGLAFKPHTDDVRESPALWLAAALHERGVQVRATDPWALANAEGHGPPISYTLDPLHAVEGAHVTVLATEWPEFVALDWRAVASRMAGAAVLDARNALEPSAVQAAGLRYRALGRDVAGRATPNHRIPAGDICAS